MRELMGAEHVRVEECGRVRLLEAIGLYELRPDKEWSLVDCASMLICEKRGIRRVLTSDRHFEQAGFEILL